MSQKTYYRQGKLVGLRPLKKEDARSFAIWMNDPNVTKFLSMYLPVTEAEEEEWIATQAKQKDDICLAIEVLSEHLCIGSVGLTINQLNQRAMLGIVIGDKKYQNGGYGTDTMMTILELAFNTLNLRKVCLCVHGNNPRAHHVYEKCGFKDVGRWKEEFFVQGQWVDSIHMEVFRDEWKVKYDEYLKK